MSKLYDHKSAQWVDVPENQINDLVRSGNYTFEDGIDIPVRAPDGQLGTIPSSNAAKAFNAGFTWATATDKQLDRQDKLEAIKEKAFGQSTTTALGMGAARGLTFGGSDVLIRAGEEAGVLPQGVVDAAKETKERQPIASGIGEGGAILAGAVMSGGTSLAGTVGRAGNAGYKLGADLGAKALTKAAGEGVKDTLARRIIAKAVPIATGSTVEGAFYGLGTGVSEAALGRSDAVVDNLISNAGFGAVTGGAFGSMFGLAAAGKPLLAKASDSIGNVFDKVVSGTARMATKGLAKASLSVAGESRLSGMVGDLIDTPLGQSARHLAQAGKWDEVADLMKHAGSVEKDLVKETKGLAKGLNKYVSMLPEAEATIVREIAAQNGGDMYKTTTQIYRALNDATEVYKTGLKALTGPTRFGAQIDEDVYEAAESLYQLGTKNATAKADQLLELMQARSERILTEGDEVFYARALKAATNDNLISMGEGYNIAHSLVKKLDDSYLKGHPNPFVKESQVEGDALYTALSAVRNVIGKGQVNPKAINRMIYDPEFADWLAPLLNKLSEYGPEMTQFGKTAKGTAERMAATKAIRQKMQHMVGESLDGKLTTDNLEDILTEFGADSQKFMRLNRLKDLEEQLAGLAEMNPMDRAIRLLKATGQDSSKIADMLPYQKHFETMDKLQSMRPDGNFVGDIAGRIVKGTIGGMIGGPTGAAIGAVMSGGTSVKRMIDTLTAIEKASNKGAKLLTASMKGAVTALTSDTLRKAVIITRAQRRDEQPNFKEKRSNFKNISKNVVEAAGNPAVIADNVASAVGTLQGTPNLKQALATKMTIAAQYLSQHMPKDPLAGRYMSADDSGWEPNDAELAQFHRRLAVVQDPKVAIDRIADGSVSPEEMDALKTVHPEIFAKLRSEVITTLIEKGTKIPYSKRISIGTIFGVPTDPSLEPAAIAKLQGTFDVQIDEGGRPEGSTSKPNLDMKPSENVALETAQLQE